MKNLALLALCLAVPVMAQQRPGGAAANRAELESQVRQEFARTVRNRVGLTDQQMARLAPVTERLARDRRALQVAERDARVGLQRALREGSAADTAAVSRMLGTLVDVQKRRAALLEQEQRELAQIMTPLQRARYMALQDQVRRRVEQRRGGRAPGGAAPPRRRPPEP